MCSGLLSYRFDSGPASVPRSQMWRPDLKTRVIEELVYYAWLVTCSWFVDPCHSPEIRL